MRIARREINILKNINLILASRKFEAQTHPDTWQVIQVKITGEREDCGGERITIEILSSEGEVTS